MKNKFWLVIFCLFLLCEEFSIAREGHPSVLFDLNNIPSKKQANDSGGGLSGGAVTAITLGSIGGLALLGLGGLLYKHKVASGLNVGRVLGHPNFVSPICLDEDINSEFYARINNEYPYLRRALNLNDIHYCPDSKYILVYDSEINDKTFDVLKFEIPEGTKRINLTLVTEEFNEKNFGIEMYGFIDDEEKISSLPFRQTEKNDFLQGIISQVYEVSQLDYPNGELIINNFKNLRKYAIVLEFVFN